MRLKTVPGELFIVKIAKSCRMLTKLMLPRYLFARRLLIVIGEKASFMSMVHTSLPEIKINEILDLIQERDSIDLDSQEDKEIILKIAEHCKEKKKLPILWTNQEQHYLNTNPKEKWLKYLIYRYKMKVYPQQRIVTDFPVYLLIEPVSSCNLRCVMCFQVDTSFTKKPFMGLMKLELFKRLIDEAVGGGTQAVTMASRGEPTLHPQLGEMLKYASEKFIDLKLNTNATKLNDKLCHDILSSSVNELVFSVDGSDKKTYEDIRVRGNFEEVVNNIKRFHEIRKLHYPNSNLRTRISGVLISESQDLEKITSFWKEIVDDVVFVRAQNRWDTYNNPLDDKNSPCHMLWANLYIWFDGVANPCDVDYKSYLSPGNYTNSSIRDIWHSDKFNQIRKSHLDGERVEINPCNRCGV